MVLADGRAEEPARAARRKVVFLFLVTCHVWRGHASSCFLNVTESSSLKQLFETYHPADRLRLEINPSPSFNNITLVFPKNSAHG